MPEPPGFPARAATPAAALEPPRAKPRPATEPAKRGICVAIDHYGKPLRLEGDAPSEFIDTLRGASIAWVNFGVQDMRQDGELIANILGFSGSLVSALMDDRHSAYEDRDTELGLKLPVVKVQGLEVEVNPLLVLVREGVVLTLHPADRVTRMQKFARYADTFMRKIPRDAPFNDKLTIVLSRIVNENNERNFDGLRSIEEQGDEIGKLLIQPAVNFDALGPQIYKMKHALISYLDTLWASLDVIQSLRYGDAEVITDTETLLAKVGILAEDVTHQVALSEHMSEVLASGLEVLQAIYNNQLQRLNNRLSLVITWLTILGTAVLVPNTLATIFASGAYNIGPEDRAWVTAVLVVSTVFATLFAYWFIKRKGLLPHVD